MLLPELKSLTACSASKGTKMKAVVQVVNSAEVKVSGSAVGKIGKGLFVLL